WPLVLGPSSLALRPWSFVLGPSSLVLRPWSFVLGPRPRVRPADLAPADRACAGRGAGRHRRRRHRGPARAGPAAARLLRALRVDPAALARGVPGRVDRGPGCADGVGLGGERPRL